MAKKKDELVPYEMLSPGFEAIFTGEKRDKPDQDTDAHGNVFAKWPMWTWQNDPSKWDEEINYINCMQEKLGPLDVEARQIRAHIASLVPCDSGFPVTVDELLNAIGRGKLDAPSFHNGCWCCGLWWEQKTSQPQQMESVKTIHAVLNAYLAGEPREDAVKAHPEAAGFINRSYQWLGAVSDLSKVQRKMLDRMLLTFDFFFKLNYTGTDPQSPPGGGSKLQDMEALGKDVFYDENGRGACLDAEISDQAGLPKIRPEWDPAYREELDKLKDRPEQELYKTCCAIASGIHTASDCHHNTFRYIESWIHGIGTGRLGIPTRKAQSEKQRLGHILFGYALGLDRWLMRVPLQFLLLDLGHIDLGFDPRNNVLRVYACLGEEVTAVKEWLAACLWYNLVHNQHGGLIGSFTLSHTDLIQQCKDKGITVDEWMDSVLRNGS